MELRLLANPIYFCIVGSLCGILGFRLGWRTTGRVTLPVLQGLLGFIAFAVAWREGGSIVGAAAVGGWAMGSTLASIGVFVREREAIDQRVIASREFREARLATLRASAGARPRLAVLLRERVRVIAPCLLAATATANLASLVLGAAMLNVVNGYVAVVVSTARRPWTVAMLGWDAWYLVRVAACILLGSACAAPLAARLGYPDHAQHVGWLLSMGGLGLVLDLVLELLLWKATRRLLARSVELGPHVEEG